MATCKNNVCDRSGNCTDGCEDGYWGAACESRCPANCEERICDSTNGFVSAVSLVTGEIHAIYNVQYIVSKEFVTKPAVAVHRDAHQDGMEICVIEHVVLGV